MLALTVAISDTLSGIDVFYNIARADSAPHGRVGAANPPHRRTEARVTLAGYDQAPPTPVHGVCRIATAQVTPNSVTVTASRNPSLQPDQVVFGVSVSTPVDATREDVIAALQGSGITLANFGSVQAGHIFRRRSSPADRAIEERVCSAAAGPGQLAAGRELLC